VSALGGLLSFFCLLYQPPSSPLHQVPADTLSTLFSPFFFLPCPPVPLHFPFFTLPNNNLVVSSCLPLCCRSKEEISLARLKTVHCFVLAGPTESLKPSEVTALQEFVDGGGSLVVLSGEGGPAATNSNLNDVLAK
jgi:hypothetical protein